ncbi:hypothetical protein JL107_04940 [Nakamurella flavida]|uniref:Uncharacterized protein n=1 Tax=Nakamurella flavida TaxID=363630 RepID=A0A939C285_9ACTN|nr:hypothetical protein [Nakamurella flavida]MBM9475786.1 hypothetical protein [Nakamurella flavida]MDP9777933.1 hypothetical protein [Nakamurella flavida]
MTAGLAAPTDHAHRRVGGLRRSGIVAVLVLASVFAGGGSGWAVATGPADTALAASLHRPSSSAQGVHGHVRPGSNRGKLAELVARWERLHGRRHALGQGPVARH